MLKAAFAPSRTILPDHDPDRHGVGDVDEEGRDERQDDEGPREAPCSFVTAVMLAIEVGVAPSAMPVNPAEITAAS